MSFFQFLVFFIFGLVHAQYGALDPIVIKGSKFFYQTNGSEFYVKGVAYQDQGHFAFASTSIIDPFADGPTCARDIPYLVQLGVNVVRAYAINPSQDHSDCMDQLANAGIYVITDLSGAKTQGITGETPTWNYELYDRYTSVVDSLQNYTNVLGFFAGNEIANSTEQTDSIAYIKAAVRDVKAYIKKQNYRDIPVGYATNDMSSTRANTAYYLNCGDQDETVDFMAVNNYAWCGQSTFTQSGYSQLVQQFRNYSVPFFFSEYGCNIPSPRNFTEVQALFGSQMTDVFSGGIVYQYYADEADFGLVTILGDSVTKAPDFNALSSQIAKISPTSLQLKPYAPTNTDQQSCPSVGSTWSASPTLPPVPYARLCSCMMQSLSCIYTNSSTDVSSSLSSICGQNSDACSGASSNGTLALYGAYSVCNSTEIYSWIYNQYYLSHSSYETACQQVGGTIQKPVASPDSDCSILLQQAGPVGTGSITSTPNIPASASISATGNSNNNNGGTGTPTPISDGSTLSGGAYAGIGIGVIVLVIIVLVLAFLLWRQRRKNRKEKTEAATDVAGSEGLKAELPDNQVTVADGPKDAQEMDQNAARHELGQDTIRQEMSSVNRDPAELEAPHGRSEVHR